MTTMRNLLITVLLFAASLASWSQSLVNGVQPTAVDGVTVVTGATAINGVALTAPGSSAPAVVQSKTTGTGGAVSTLAMTSSVTVGNILVAAEYYGGGAGNVPSFSDSLGNTVTVMASASVVADGDSLSIACAPITTGGADTISFSVPAGTPNAMRAVVYEVSGAICTQDVTAVSSNTTAATACTSGAMTTTTANDFLVAICGTDGTQASAIAAGSGWSGGLNAGSSPSVMLMSEYRTATTPGSFTATSGAITSQEQATLLVALKP